MTTANSALMREALSGLTLLLAVIALLVGAMDLLPTA